MHLAKRGSGIENIQSDFGNGIKLVQLLEAIGGESLGKINNNPKMKIHKIENINVALKYVATKGVKLVGISSEDIEGENLKLILGMIWTIILRFAIADISEEELNAKEALLLWCKKKTAGYKDVKVENFTNSWQDGLALCALIHAHRPDLLDFNSLSKSNPHDNCKLAFEIAEKELGIPQLLDIEDLVDVPKPEERSVMTYIAQFYHVFSANRKNEIAGRRIGKLVDFNKAIEELRHDYETKAGAHTAWLQDATQKLGDRNFDNTLEGIKKLIADLNKFKTEEKPPKVDDKISLSSLNNSIQVKLSSAGHPAYVPPAGLSTQDINELWDALEKAQQAREDALLAELARQQLLDLLAAKFNNKATQLENWIEKQTDYLNKDENIDSVEAAEQKVKALQAFKQEYEQNKERLKELHGIKDEYVKHDGNQKEAITERADKIQKAFDGLNDLANSKNNNLDSALQRQREMEELRKKFANAAKEYNFWTKDTNSSVSATVFPDSLEGVQEYKAELDSSDASIKSTNDSKKSNLDDLWAQEQAMGIKENPYTVFTNEDIAAWHKGVLGSLDGRQTAYNSELERQKRNEEKRKEFAAKADEFVNHLDSRKNALDALTGEPAELIASLKQNYDDGKPEDALLKSLSDLQEELAGLGITDNRHTKYTLPALKVHNDRLNKYVRNKINALEQEDELKRSYNDAVSKLLKWIAETQPTIRSEFDNTLEGARNTKNKWTDFKTTVRAQKGLEKLNLESLFNKIQATQKANNRPAYAPDASLSLETVSQNWDAYANEEKKWEADVNAELARQERLALLVRHFNSEAEVLGNWIADKENQINDKKAIASLDDSRIQLLTLDVFDEEYASSASKVESVKARATEIASLNYKDTAGINGQVSDLESKWSSVKDLAANRRKELESENSNQETREALRIDFADKAKGYLIFVRDTKILLDDNNFGTTLEDVQNFLAKLEESESSVRNQSNAKRAEVQAAADKLTENGISDNKHTSLTVEDVNQAAADLENALTSRRAAYDVELKRQQEYDADRQKFAAQAAEFVAFLNEQTTAMKSATGTPSEKSAAVKGIFAEGAPAKQKIDQLNEFNTAMRQKGIYSNKYTPHTMLALDRRLQLFVEAVNSLLSYFLEEEDFLKREADNEKEWQHKQDQEQKRLDFEVRCQALIIFADSVQDPLTDPISVSTIGAVEDLVKEYEAIVNQINEKRGEYDALLKEHGELVGLGLPVTHEVTTSRWNQVNELLATRKAQLDNALVTQTNNDNLNKQFAEKANVVENWVAKTAASLNTSGDAESQLQVISGVNTDEGQQLLQDLAALGAQLSAAHVVTNPYTSATVPSLKAKVEEVAASKKSKESALAQALLAKQDSSASPEQIAEFKEVFKHFDKNNTNSLSKLEFKSVLQSLGEDPSDTKMDSLMAELADVDVGDAGGKQIGFNKFLAYMIKISSDTSSQDEISAAFKDLAGDKDFITADDLRRSGMPTDKVEYLLKELPAYPGVEGAYDYKKWASSH